MKYALLWIPWLLLSASALADDCNPAANQADLNQCYDAQYQKQDRLLNQTYQHVLERTSGQQRSQLETAQNAWLALRAADCAFLSSGAEQGSVYPMVHAICLADKTRERNELLKSTLLCEEGDVSCVLAPK